MRDSNLNFTSYFESGAALLIIVDSVSIAFMLCLACLILAMTRNIVSQEGLTAQNFTKQALCTVLILVQSGGYIPLIDLTARSIWSGLDLQDGRTSTLLLVGALLLVMLALFEIFLAKLFTLNIKTSLIPWCQLNSKVTFIEKALTITLVFSASSLQLVNDPLTVFEGVALFLAFSGVTLYKFMYIPHFNYKLNILLLVRGLALSLIFLISLICMAVHDTNRWDLLYVALLLAPGAWYLRGR